MLIPGEGFQIWVCVCVYVCDFMYRSWTAAQLKCVCPPPPTHTHTQLAIAVTETGVWDPLIWMDRVQAQLTSSCSFLSNASRKKAGRVEGGGQSGLQWTSSLSTAWKALDFIQSIFLIRNYVSTYIKITLHLYHEYMNMSSSNCYFLSFIMLSTNELKQLFD